ncbi:diguanylate cyclase [Kistimonas asteriae]|uniref:diguanylate cyclase n=1 Tax=Kistimonas asteriae TaxID=517724 RepID=UPI001BA58FD2|nr:diguanylate cyclase [Kistimonas asteriae]
MCITRTHTVLSHKRPIATTFLSVVACLLSAPAIALDYSGDTLLTDPSPMLTSFTEQLLTLSLGMLLALIIFNICIFIRARKSSYLFFAIYTGATLLYLVSSDASRLDLPAFALDNWVNQQPLFFGAIATAFAIRFMLSLIPVKEESHSIYVVCRTLYSTLLLIAGSCLLNLSSLDQPLTTLFHGVLAITFIALSASSLILIRKKHSNASFFFMGWLAISLGSLASLLAIEGYASDVLRWTHYPALVVQAIAFSLALPAYTTTLYRTYQQNYALMENSLQRHYRHRRIYNDAVKHYLDNLNGMDEEAIGSRLLSTLNSLLPINTCALLHIRNNQISVIGLSGQQKIVFEQLVDGRLTLLGNIARSAEEATLQMQYDHHQAASVSIIPVLWESSHTWTVVLLRQYDKTPLDKDQLQLASDIASHTRTLFQASKRYDELRREADLDDLTGMCNRRSFQRDATAMLERLQQEAKPATLLYMDIDHFKPLNDTYGHAFGDKVLQMFADVCRNNLRNRDLLARIGGEEFVVLIPQATPARTQQIAERIRTGLLALKFDELNAEKVTLSIGLSSTEYCGYDLERLLEAADRALYQAKADGRNRIRHSEPETHSLI